jgi:hypothetical protein
MDGFTWLTDWGHQAPPREPPRGATPVPLSDDDAGPEPRPPADAAGGELRGHELGAGWNTWGFIARTASGSSAEKSNPNRRISGLRSLETQGPVWWAAPLPLRRAF